MATPFGASFGKQPSNLREESSAFSEDSTSKPFPKGVVLDKDGKPCRTCTSSSAWMAMMKSSTSSSKHSSASSSASSSTTTSTSSSPPKSILTPQPPPDCPADVEELGRATWTFLHTLAANYPSSAPQETQARTRSFMGLFSQLYPCWVCADDLRDWMGRDENEIKVGGQDEFGNWLCRAHNAVNVKLGKKEFDCRLWKQRWRDGWEDGRCDG